MCLGMTGKVTINSLGFRNPRFFLDGVDQTGGTETYVIVSVAVMSDGVSVLILRKLIY